jgi:sugar O-acyltransferase (sialic acid O-acetyltransferase NeuD family)
VTRQKLLVFGAGGHGKVVADVGRSAGWVLEGFIDDDPDRQRSGVWGLPVLSWDRALAGPARAPGLVIALGVGDNGARQRCCERILGAGLSIGTLVHPSAVVASTARLGRGTVAMALAAVNPDAAIGDGVILNTGSVVEHDCQVGRFAHLSPNSALGGAARIGDCTHLGLGAVVLPGVVVGADVRVGAGAVVHRAVPDGTTVMGVPARPRSAREGGGSK